MKKITPFLWFDNNLEEAMNFYSSIFKNAKITEVNRFGEGSSVPGGTVLTARFQLEDQEFFAINGGPEFKFNEAISFYVDCADQAEVDYFWEKLTEGGEESQCGWLKDKYGLSWQFVPKQLTALVSDKDTTKANRALQAMLQMKKINVAELEKAFNGN